MCVCVRVHACVSADILVYEKYKPDKLKVQVYSVQYNTMTISEVSCFEGTNMVRVYIGIEVSCLSTLFKEGLLALRYMYTAGVVLLRKAVLYVVDEYYCLDTTTAQVCQGYINLGCPEKQAYTLLMRANQPKKAAFHLPGFLCKHSHVRT